VIISASYRTDIPAFYGDWFMRRLRAGFCQTVNPYGGQVQRIPLDRASVDGFVFWTKNVGPFLRHLPEVSARGDPFVVQLGIMGYPRDLETAVVDAERSIADAWRIREAYGPQVVVWRYDTIVTTSLTPPGFHLENFDRLAGKLAGATDEVVVSFAQIYRKTRRNLDLAGRGAGFTWRDPSPEEKRALASELVAIARRHALRLTLCAQRELLVPGAGDARCIDAERLARVAGRPIGASAKGHRKECGCFESRDIGAYDTCPQGCVYCYAVQNQKLALKQRRAHDPASAFLVPPPEDAETGAADAPPGPKLPLFRQD
jgi:hypothetical protein